MNEHLIELMATTTTESVTDLIVWLNPARFQGVSQILSAWEAEMLKELDFTNEFANLERVRSSLLPLFANGVIVPAPLMATRR